MVKTIEQKRLNKRIRDPDVKGDKRKVSTRDPSFGGSCVPKPLTLNDSNFTGVPQEARSIKPAKIGVHSAKTGKIRVK